MTAPKENVIQDLPEAEAHQELARGQSQEPEGST